MPVDRRETSEIINPLREYLEAYQAKSLIIGGLPEDVSFSDIENGDSLASKMKRIDALPWYKRLWLGLSTEYWKLNALVATRKILSVINTPHSALYERQLLHTIIARELHNYSDWVNNRLVSFCCQLRDSRVTIEKGVIGFARFSIVADDYNASEDDVVFRMFATLGKSDDLLLDNYETFCNKIITRDFADAIVLLGDAGFLNQKNIDALLGCERWGDVEGQECCYIGPGFIRLVKPLIDLKLFDQESFEYMIYYCRIFQEPTFFSAIDRLNKHLFGTDIFYRENPSLKRKLLMLNPANPNLKREFLLLRDDIFKLCDGVDLDSRDEVKYAALNVAERINRYPGLVEEPILDAGTLVPMPGPYRFPLSVNVRTESVAEKIVPEPYRMGL